MACTSDAAFTVTLGVVAFREGGAGAVGLVALLRMLPSALGSTVLTAYADRLRRERVLVVASVVRAAALAATAMLLAAGAPAVTIYALAVVVTAAMTIFRPVHSALQPLLCTDTTELTSANVVRGVLEAVATLAGPVLAGIVLAVASPSAAFVVVAAVTILSVSRCSASPPTPRPSELRRGDRRTRACAGRDRDLRPVFGLGFRPSRGPKRHVAVAFDRSHRRQRGGHPAFALGVGGVLGSSGARAAGSRHLGAWLCAPRPVARPSSHGGGPRLLDCFHRRRGRRERSSTCPLHPPVRLVSDAALACASNSPSAYRLVGLGSLLARS